MKVWAIASGLYEGLEICIRIVWRSEKKAAGFYECLKLLHQDCMRVWANCIRMLWRSGKKGASGLYEGQKIASGFYEGLKNCIRTVWRSEQIASGLYDGLKKCFRILWRSEKMRQDFMQVRKCIRILWRSEKCESRLYEGLSNLHLLLMSASKNTMHQYISQMATEWHAQCMGRNKKSRGGLRKMPKNNQNPLTTGRLSRFLIVSSNQINEKHSYSNTGWQGWVPRAAIGSWKKS